ncbi:DUF7594 domain-containing protein [Segetibacter koreensis]|uniref:CBM96 family carbohydrate-binding protein n=1 Tax=Segetibacter koreensis TaxID=398037 RepID=UPI00037AAC2D|nr:DNRLRE domain-containing protein [Segetibacter koreensis]
MNKNYSYFSSIRLKLIPLKFCFLGFFLFCARATISAQSSDTLSPVADAFVRNGSYASTNYGSDTSLIVKSATSSGYSRSSYLKFSLNTLTNISSAKIRIYGRNTDNTSSITISAYSIDNDSWSESTISYNNAPATTSAALSSAGVTDQGKYYEFDVTNYVKAQFAGDKIVSFLIKDASTQNKNIVFNSKENLNNTPQLVVTGPAPDLALLPLADAFVRNGSYGGTNYGSDTSLIIKGSTSSGYTRASYLKFSLGNASKVGAAKLRIFGRNADNTASVNISAYSVDNDSWTESTITFSNAPTASTTALSSASVTDQSQYYEFDVTDYVKAQFAGDKVVSFLVKDPSNQNKNLVFNSKENGINAPQLVIGADEPEAPQGNVMLFVENLDRFPSNDLFVFSRVQIPWSRDGITYNANHDSLTVRIHNKGINNLVIKDLSLSNNAWQFVKLKGVDYVAGTSLPITITSGNYADLTVKFVAADAGTRVKILQDTLTITSNDDKFPSKNVFFSGIWQKQGESNNEPYAQEIITAFGFKTKTGFSHTDPDKGDSTKLKGDEILPSYFVTADPSLPITIRQMASYHGCCTQPERIMWYSKGSDSLISVFSHIGKDAQSVLPRKGTPNTPAEGSINPTTPFGFKVGGRDYTDAKKNPSGKIGIRVWKAFDAKGNIMPNTYIISNDYLGSQYTNYDYNDNMYLVKNIKPLNGSAFFSALDAAPSAVDFGEQILQSQNSLQLNLSSLGNTYPDGSKDPAITIASIAIAGENKSEFTASMPVKTSLDPQENTAMTINFNPTSEGLKIADLLVYYNNSQSPLRVPLYGIAKASTSTVVANYRVNSGSATPITINGKTWSADNQYSFDNLEPFTNSKLSKISGTDEDALYLKEQSSNGDKKPFRYEFPVTNGDYVVRLHFAEIYWGAPGTGLTGGTGSRVMNVSVENQLRLVNFDVTQEVGGAAALVKNLPVTVTDGKLNIDFSATVNRPMVMAVEVYSFRSGTAARPALSAISDSNVKKVKAYPNPVQKMLMLQFPITYSGNSDLQIVDATGKTYEMGKFKILPGGSNMQVDISRLSLKPGFYYLKIVSETRPVETIKLIVP